MQVVCFVSILLHSVIVFVSFRLLLSLYFTVVCLFFSSHNLFCIIIKIYFSSCFCHAATSVQYFVL